MPETRKIPNRRMQGRPANMKINKNTAKRLLKCITSKYKKHLIRNPNFQIKKGIPFLPFLTLGYFSFLILGDFIYIISSFIKAMF